MSRVSRLLLMALLGVTGAFMTASVFSFGNASTEAPAGFDNQTNGLVLQEKHDSDRGAFEEVENIDDGLGPIYNAQSCRECHQNPTTGAISQVSELRVGHSEPNGEFANPNIPIARGTFVVRNRSLVNDRAICPNAAFPNEEIQERVPDSETIRALRMSLNVLGDGFVEAISDATLLSIAKAQPGKSYGRIHGQALQVPILEASGETRIGRFGWKAQHGSLFSFSADAYVNEMGITNSLIPDEVVDICNTVGRPNNTPSVRPPDTENVEDIVRFARFMRATKVPPRDNVLAGSAEAQQGAQLFERIKCSICHVSEMVTAPTGTRLFGNYVVDAALGGKKIHPFSDFLLHNVGTGDGIVQAPEEHFGKGVRVPDFDEQTRFKLRTPPLWGVRTHSRLMHDGGSLTLMEAILRHRGEAEEVIEAFRALSPQEKQAVITFLKSL